MNHDKSINTIKIIQAAKKANAVVLTDWEEKFLADIEEDVNSRKTLTWCQGKKLREIYDKIQ